MNSTIKPKPCPTCNSPFHSKMYHNPRKAVAVNKPLQTSHTPLKHWKRPKQLGKHAELWSDTRRRWIAANHANHKCHYCGIQLNLETITLDHRTPRSRAPELRYELTNLVPCCFDCNYKKGSVDHDHYKHNCPDNKQRA